jgi:hypothetical protein
LRLDEDDVPLLPFFNEDGRASWKPRVILFTRGATMKRRGIIPVMVAMVLATSLSACGGGGAKSTTQTDIKTTTTGQELMDLQKALESGAITQKEYEKQKKRILEGK